MSWKNVKICNIKSDRKYSLVGGPFGSNLSGKHYVVSGVPVIRGGNLPFAKKFDCTDFVFVSEKKANSLKSNTAYPGDIVFTQRGTLGQVGIVPNDYGRYIISQSQMKLTVDPVKAFPLYVYYYFRTEEAVKRIENVALSSGVPHTNLGILQNFKIPLPDLPVQKKIASILSAYDNLIENNNQRIKLLEEMAEEIYKEWFVRMRFPGYQGCKFFDQEGNEVPHGTEGALPEGWEKVKLGDLIDVKRGSSPRPISDQKYFNGGTIPWLKIADATASRIYIYRTKEYVNDYGASFSRRLPKGSLIVAASGTLGFPMFLGVEACIHDGWLYFKGVEDVMKEYFYFSFGGLKQYFKNQSYGAAIQNINTEIVSKSPFVNPDRGVLSRFRDNIAPLFKEIEVLQLKNQVLQETRDLLLPRLISGKLDVSKMSEQDLTDDKIDKMGLEVNNLQNQVIL